MINKKKIAGWFDARGLWAKPFNQFSEDEIDGLITVILNSPDSNVPAHGWEPPFIGPDGELVIPMNSHPRYHWWSFGQSIKATLDELKVPQEILDKHMSKLQGLPI